MPEILLTGTAKIILSLIAGLLLTVLPFWHICKRTGLHPALSFLSIVPLANIIFRFYLAIARWPAQEIKDVVDDPATQNRRKIRPFLITIGAFMLALAPLIIITGTAYTFTLPKIYVSQTLVQTVFSEDAYNNYDAATLESLTHTYAEKITGAPVLYETIKRLDLQTKWGHDSEPIPKEVARKILRSSITPFFYRHSIDLIMISVKRQHPNEAAQIANTLAQVYQAVAKNDTEQANPYSVAIIETAAPATRPVSPNLILNVLISIGTAGVFILIGTPLLVIGLKR